PHISKPSPLPLLWVVVMFRCRGKLRWSLVRMAGSWRRSARRCLALCGSGRLLLVCGSSMSFRLCGPCGRVFGVQSKTRWLLLRAVLRFTCGRWARAVVSMKAPRRLLLRLLSCGTQTAMPSLSCARDCFCLDTLI
ncbi:hypothetical protein IWW38_006006, partial [Coemansia aciculifera]